jgi:hypothetical protein
LLYERVILSRHTVPLKNLLAAWATLLVAVIVAVDVPVTPLVTLNAEVIPAQKTLKKNSGNNQVNIKKLAVQ